MTLNSLINPSIGDPLEVRTSRHPAIASFDLNAKRDENYIIGLDLGQSRDFTAVAVVRRVDEPGCDPVYQVGNIYRLALNTPYPDIVSHVVEFVSRRRFRGKYELVIDFGGVGRPVFDMFRARRLFPIGVSLTGGNQIVDHHDRTYSVPKSHVVSGIQSILHTQLKIRSELPGAAELIKEVEAFQADFSDTGHMRFNARSGAHDDLIMALGIAIWRARGEHSHAGDHAIAQLHALYGGGSWSQTQSPQAKFRLKRPDGVASSTLYLSDGTRLNLNEDGIAELPEDDAIALLKQGWQRIEAAS